MTRVILLDPGPADVFAGLLAAGFAVSRVAQGHAVRPALAGEATVLAGFDAAATDAVDLAGLSPEDAVLAVSAATEPTPRPKKPWFPVIDYDRCTNCMQCMSFCLFDVYGLDDAKKIQVQNHGHCKTDCPACSRVCPEAAIMFPKYRKGPINGDVVQATDIEREAMKVDISALLGGDVYGVLRARSQSARQRFSTERDASKALLERRRCLEKLGGRSDIPAEVLMSLPSAGDITERAERAREKAERRRSLSQSVADAQRAAEAQKKVDDDWGLS